MGAAIASKVFLNDIPVQFIKPFEIRLSRGWEPWRFAVGVTDDRFDELDNPITIKIETVGEFNDDTSILELENWHVTAKLRNNENSYDLIIQDSRWLGQYSKLIASYNIKWWGEESDYRQETTDAGDAWNAIDAVEDALFKLGFTVDTNPQIPTAIEFMKLPDNLGPSPGGGFAGVSYREAMPILAASIAIDVIQIPNGNLKIVDRVTDQSQFFVGQPAIAGRIEPRIFKWSQPQNLIVLIPKRIERRFDYLEISPVQTAAGKPFHTGLGLNSDLENVIPDYEPTGNVAGGEYKEFYGEVQDNVRYGRNTVLRRIKIPGIFPWGDPTFMRRFGGGAGGKVGPAEEYTRYRWFETQMQNCWRRIFRVKKETFKVGEVMRPFANIQLGRLAQDGTTRSGDAVHMDYVKINRYAHYPPGKGPGVKGGTMFDAIYSDNIDIDEINPAPFEVSWLTDDVDELILQVTPRIAQVHEREYIPGAYRRSLKLGDIQDLVNNEPIEIIESTVEMLAFFRMQIYYHGLQVEDITALGDEGKRMFELKRSLFPSGEGPDLFIKANDITANFSFVDDGYPSINELQNFLELQIETDRIQFEVGKSYTAGKHGSITYGSVFPIVADILTGGDIYDTIISVGVDQQFTISVSYLVIPSVAQTTIPRVDLSGTPIRIVEGG